MRLVNKTAVIYGAAGAIGGAVARAFAREGATLFLSGRNQAKVDAVARDIRASGGKAEASQVDAQDETVDIDMNRGFDRPKAAPEAVARGIFDGVQKGEEDIFPDPVSRAMAEGWRSGVVKAFERQYAGFLPQSMT